MNEELEFRDGTGEFRDQIREKLRSGLLNVIFTKKNGETREMKATLNESIIKDHDAEPKGNNKGDYEEKEYQRVFDVEKGEWRMFRWNSLIAIDEDT